MNTAPRLFITVLATACLPLAAGCTSSQEREPDPLDPDVFVSAMAHLSQVYQFPPGGSASVDVEVRADSLREEILREHGITVAQLLAFAEQVGREPARMEELAERIATLNDSLTAERDPVEVSIGDGADAPLPATTRASLAADTAKSESFRSRLDSLRQEFRRSRP